jgi:hypothetical protein
MSDTGPFCTSDDAQLDAVQRDRAQIDTCRHIYTCRSPRTVGTVQSCSGKTLPIRNQVHRRKRCPLARIRYRVQQTLSRLARWSIGRAVGVIWRLKTSCSEQQTTHQWPVTPVTRTTTAAYPVATTQPGPQEPTGFDECRDRKSEGFDAPMTDETSLPGWKNSQGTTMQTLLGDAATVSSRLESTRHY